MNECCIGTALETFLAGFPDEADSWAKATDELPDMYGWISADGQRFPSVGRDNCRTPAEWNQKYKAAIRAGFAQLDKKTKDAFAKRFSYWLTGVEE
jgi:hypothetical protein